LATESQRGSYTLKKLNCGCWNWELSNTIAIKTNLHAFFLLFYSNSQ
jgi:hypothetical protein